MMAPRTWRSSSCGISFGYCAARAAGPSSPHATGSCSPPPAGCSPDSGGHRCSSRPDAAALAPHARPTEVDLRQGAYAWQATDRPADRGSHRADRQGQRPVGLHADLWGAAQARHPGGRHDHQDAAATTRPGPGAATRRDAPGRAGRSFFERRPRGSWPATCSRWRRSGSRHSTEMSGAANCSAASSMSITRSQPDESRFPRPTDPA